MPALRTHDDRGHPVQFPLRRILDAARYQWRERSPITLRRGLRLIRSVCVRGGTLVFVAALVLIVVLALVARHDISTGLWMLIFSPVYASMLTLAFAGVRGMLGLGIELPDWIRLTLLRADRCPACLYELRGVEPAADGCVGCAECGASWEKRRMGLGAPRGPDVVVISEPKGPPATAR